MRYTLQNDFLDGFFKIMAVSNELTVDVFDLTYISRYTLTMHPIHEDIPKSPAFLWKRCAQSFCVMDIYKTFMPEEQ